MAGSPHHAGTVRPPASAAVPCTIRALAPPGRTAALRAVRPLRPLRRPILGFRAQAIATAMGDITITVILAMVQVQSAQATQELFGAASVRTLAAANAPADKRLPILEAKRAGA
jgi:hypothetical protein